MKKSSNSGRRPEDAVDYAKVARMRAILADPVRRAAYLSGERVDMLVEKLVRLWADDENKDESDDQWTPAEDLE